MQKVKSRFTLKTAREMKRYTQEEAAKLIGVSVDTLGNYERGKSYPDVPGYGCILPALPPGLFRPALQVLQNT